MLFFILIVSLLILSCTTGDHQTYDDSEKQEFELPAPTLSSSLSVEEAMAQRRSVRSYSDTPVTIDEIGQLLWAAQGITDENRDYRTAPSAGATFPLEIYVAIRGSETLPDGVYAYHARRHLLKRHMEGDLRADIRRVALQQESITEASVVLLITGVLSRIEARYGDRAMRFMYMEAGHVAQNIYLQSESMGIGTVVIGAFDDSGLQSVLNLPDGEYPLYIMPIGKP
ncbi:SagB/ThcOx family dehydrogenase [Balneolaceae bacterium ANBcel3]|nr:SagB/ThcOx family dehydrogenase [Balneolaceae bacterium ANBcel3]